MRLEWLEDILAVSDCGSFAAAAEQRYLTPSAFTRRIKSIERALGCELFDRSRKPIQLSSHALACIPEIRNALAALRSVKTQLSEPDFVQQRRISLVCQHTLTASWAPRLIEAISSESEINFRVRSGTKSECLMRLIKKEVQFALTYEAIDEVAAIETQFTDRILLGQETFIPVAKVAPRSSLEKSLERNRVPVIFYPPSIYLGEVQSRTVLSKINADLTLVTVAETGLGPAVAEFVKRGLGVGWLPPSILEPELAAGELRSLTDILPSFTMNVILSRSAGPLPKLAENFWRDRQVRV